MRRVLIVSMLFALLQVIACLKPEEVEEAVTGVSWAVISYSMDQLSVNDAYSWCPESSPVLAAPNLDEASGMAASANFPNHFWSHNDSGHPNHLFLIHEDGSCMGRYQVNGAGSRDWEDICRGPGPLEGTSYLYVGDIGDNVAQHPYVVIYRVVEPTELPEDPDLLANIPAESVERFEFVYPDGPRDAECLMIDPWTKELYLVSKRDFRSFLYRVPMEAGNTERNTLEKLAELPLNWVLAGDISSDGQMIVLKDFAHCYLWTRNTGESVLDALHRVPQTLPYQVEPQGESFAWLISGEGYVTLSEQSGIHPPDLNFYKTVE